MRAPNRLLAAAGLALAAVTCVAAPADAATLYPSCAAVHKHYSGGIAKAGVKYNVVHHRNGTTTRVLLKGSVLHSTAVYNANKRLDADHDGVACEKG